MFIYTGSGHKGSPCNARLSGKLVLAGSAVKPVYEALCLEFGAGWGVHASPNGLADAPAPTTGSPAGLVGL